MTARFYNYMNQRFEDTAVEPESDRSWYIKMGFAGFNSPANNLGGYPSRERAEAAVLRYQNK